MTLDDFRQSLTASKPPAGLTLALAGLWWDAKGDWTRAHESAQQDEGVEGSWVHAYPYAAYFFFPALTFAHRARCAAAILFLPAADIVRLGFGA